MERTLPCERRVTTSELSSPVGAGGTTLRLALLILSNALGVGGRIMGPGPSSSLWIVRNGINSMRGAVMSAGSVGKMERERKESIQIFKLAKKCILC